MYIKKLSDCLIICGQNNTFSYAFEYWYRHHMKLPVYTLLAFSCVCVACYIWSSALAWKFQKDWLVFEYMVVYQNTLCEGGLWYMWNAPWWNWRQIIITALQKLVQQMIMSKDIIISHSFVWWIVATFFVLHRGEYNVLENQLQG